MSTERGKHKNKKKKGRRKKQQQQQQQPDKRLKIEKSILV